MSDRVVGRFLTCAWCAHTLGALQQQRGRTATTTWQQMEVEKEAHRIAQRLVLDAGLHGVEHRKVQERVAAAHA